MVAPNNGVSRTFTYNLGAYDKITVEAATYKARRYIKTLDKMRKRTSGIEQLAAISLDSLEAPAAETPPTSPTQAQELYRELYEDALRAALEAKAKADAEAAVKAMSFRRN